jgi:hypothetical protein
MDAIRRFAAGRRSPRVVEKRTYLFILVPFNLRRNGHVRKAHITQDLIGNGSCPDGTRAEAVLSTIAALDRTSSRTTAERDLNNSPELNHDLMWTWFLPNPLWPPNKSEWKLLDLFRFGLNGFKPKTRSER